MGSVNLSGEVALVTGAGKGVGRSIAEAIARCGASTACQDTTPINLDETISSIRSKGGRASDYIFDLTRKMPVQAMIEQVISDWGRLDILVNNYRVKPQASILKMDEWDWHYTIDINLGGAFFTMQSASRVMQDLGGGVIINITDVPGEIAAGGEYSAYYASMSGLIELTRQAARELDAHRVRVNAVACYCNQEKLVGKSPSIQEDIPIRELNYVRKIVEVVLFLCSSAGARISGEVIKVEVEN